MAVGGIVLKCYQHAGSDNSAGIAAAAWLPVARQQTASEPLWVTLASHRQSDDCVLCGLYLVHPYTWYDCWHEWASSGPAGLIKDVADDVSRQLVPLTICYVGDLYKDSIALLKKMKFHEIPGTIENPPHINTLSCFSSESWAVYLASHAVYLASHWWATDGTQTCHSAYQVSVEEIRLTRYRQSDTQK